MGKVDGEIKRYEQALKLKKNLTEASVQVSQLRKSKGKKETLKEFLNEV